jgi:hypothetical protein
MLLLKQSTAVDVLIGPFVDITDGITGETGESPVVKLSKNGQTLTAKNDATTPVSDADGYYNCELDATDTNTVGNMVLTVAATATAAPIRHEFQVGLVAEIWDEVLTGATHNITSSSGKRLRQIDAGFEVHSGTADAGGASTIDFETGVASTVDDIYNGDRVVITAGTGQGEHGLILDYVGSTQQATMSKAWVVTPDNTSEYIVLPADCDVELWNDTAVTGDGDWAAQKAETVLILADTNELQSDDVPGLIASLDAVVDTVKAETVLILADTNELQTDDVPGLIAALNDAPAVSVADILTTQMTEAYAADGAAPTLAQALMMIQQILGEFSISGTTLTVKKVDGATSAATYTLDDATNPTSLTRAT